jgi:hypothetical protein
MIDIRKSVFIALILLWAVTTAAPQENFLHHSISATLLVADADQSSDGLSDWADRVGGYFLLKSGEEVVIRFPYSEVGALRNYLEEISELVVDISLQAVDLREDILGLQSGIQSREEILERNLTFIDQADVKGTLAIEKEVMWLLQEVEQLKGRLRKLTADRLLARAHVRFRFREQTLPTDIPSSFQWINTIDFYSFVSSGNRR